VLFILTLLPTAIIALAIYSQIVDVGWGSIYISAGAIVLGIIVYYPIRKYVKQKNNIPDIDPFVIDDDVALQPAAARAD
jgi:hypothetical protein